MKRRLIACLMVIAMLVTMTPTEMFAADEEGNLSESAKSYTVGTAEEFTSAIENITTQSESDAIITLTANVRLSDRFAGVEGKHVTLTSEGEEPFSITLAPELVGDLTLDRVDVSVSRDTLYACGHTFETTSAFSDNGIKYLYGGGPADKDVEGNTNLIIRGGTFIYVFGGGLDSDVSGNTNVLIDAENSRYDVSSRTYQGTVVIDNLYGGGRAQDENAGEIGGNVNLHVRQGLVKDLTGGGSNETGEENGREPATITGDINLTVGYEGAEPCSALIGTVTDSMAGPYHSTVTNINMNLLQGTVNYPPANESGAQGTSGSGNTSAAGMYSDVLGCITVTVKDAHIGQLIGGGGVEGSDGPFYDSEDGYDCRILNKNKEENAIHIIWDVDKSIDEVNNDSHGIVALNDLGNNLGQPHIDYVDGNILVEFQNGDLDFIQIDDGNEGNSVLNGNATVKVTGGRMAYIRGNMNNYKDEEEKFSSTVIFDGCSDTEIGYLYYLNDANLVNNAQVIIDSTQFPEFSYAQKPFYSVDNLSIDSGTKLTTENSGQARILNGVTLKGTWDQKYVSGSTIADDSERSNADLRIGNYIDVDGGTLLSHGTVHVYNDLEATGGNLVFYQPAIVGMSTVDTDRSFAVKDTNIYLPVIEAGTEGYPEEENSFIRLAVGEKATGNANVYLFEGDDYTKQAKIVDGNVGQNYINGQHAVSDAVFTLANDGAKEDGYYFKRVEDKKNSPTSYDMWQIAKGEPQLETITIYPEDQTIYTGGANGSGTGNEFPHPIYLVDGNELENVTFTADGWTATDEQQYPFTVKYFDENDKEITTDEQSGDFTAKIVPIEGVDADKITTSDGENVEFATGVLRIRYVSNYESASENLLTNEALTYTEENKETIMAQAEAGGKATALLPEGTEICLNGDKSYPYPVDTDSKISLFFDDLLPASADGSGLDFVGEMTDRAEVLGFDVDGKNAQFKYLDLVDSNNSNAWVSSSAGSEIFWPYPEGCSSEDEIQLLHFKGLHREYRMGNDDTALKDLIAQAEVEAVDIQKTDAGIWFSIPESGFSPFALVWEEKSEPSWPDWPDWPPVGPGDDDDDDNEPPILNTQDHFSYVVGYAEDYRTGQPTDNEDLWPVKPQNNITRAEVASIFYRLLKEDVRDENTTDVSDFSDVKSSDWYGTTVATLAEMNILKGYEDGTFRPNASITRAEFAAIATRFFEETGATYEPGTFTDVTGSEWFAGAIMDAVNLGLIGGYEDGTVRPNNNITRAEACAIVNRTLGRVPDADHLLPENEMKTWPDNPESAWFYADMQEATNGHEYEWITEDGNKVENWIDLLDKDWNDRSVN